MAIQEKLKADLVTAMKAKDEARLTVLRSLNSAIHNAAIEAGGELDEPAVTAVLQKQLKQRQESQAAYAERPELAAQEEAEAKVIQEYLPEPLSTEEVQGLVDEAIKETGATAMSDMGKVMAYLKDKTAGRADSGQLAGLVKDRLG